MNIPTTEFSYLSARLGDIRVNEGTKTFGRVTAVQQLTPCWNPERILCTLKLSDGSERQFMQADLRDATEEECDKFIHQEV